jgi:hypothetical protein
LSFKNKQGEDIMYKPPTILIGMSDIPKKFIPKIPGTEVTYAKNYDELLKKSLDFPFDCIVTTLNHHKKALGLELLERTKQIDAKKIICTEKNQGIKKIIEALGGIVLHQSELPTLNALAFRDVPLQTNGKILINFPSNEFWLALPRQLQKKIIETQYSDVVVGIFNENTLLLHLQSNQIKLIIDTSPSNYFGNTEPSILENIFRDHRFKQNIPKLVILRDRKTLSLNIYRILKREHSSKA